MKVSNADRAVVPERKVRDYLLAPDHPGGGSKADFFFRHGFRRESPNLLSNALRQHIVTGDRIGTRENPHGMLYIVEGNLESPDGSNPPVRSIWLIEDGSELPRLITAYPAERKRR